MAMTQPLNPCCSQNPHHLCDLESHNIPLHGILACYYRLAQALSR
jgi:hypothetical protein